VVPVSVLNKLVTFQQPSRPTQNPAAAAAAPSELTIPHALFQGNATFRPPKPPTYDGCSSWDTFNKMFDLTVRASRWNSEQAFLAFITSLTGTEADVILTLPTAIYESNNYVALRTHLGRISSTTVSPRTAVMELHQRKQEKK